MMEVLEAQRYMSCKSYTWGTLLCVFSFLCSIILLVGNETTTIKYIVIPVILGNLFVSFGEKKSYVCCFLFVFVTIDISTIGIIVAITWNNTIPFTIHEGFGILCVVVSSIGRYVSFVELCSKPTRHDTPYMTINTNPNTEMIDQGSFESVEFVWKPTGSSYRIPSSTKDARELLKELELNSNNIMVV